MLFKNEGKRSRSLVSGDVKHLVYLLFSKFLLSPIILVVSVDVNLNTMFTSQIHKVLSVSELGLFFLAYQHYGIS